MIFGDHDGVVVVPKEIIHETVTKALDKVSGENQMRKALENGMGIVEAFNKYGIL